MSEQKASSADGRKRFFAAVRKAAVRKVSKRRLPSGERRGARLPYAESDEKA